MWSLATGQGRQKTEQQQGMVEGGVGEEEWWFLQMWSRGATPMFTLTSPTSCLLNPERGRTITLEHRATVRVTSGTRVCR